MSVKRFCPFAARRTVTRDHIRHGTITLFAASVFHFGIVRIPELKAHLEARGIAVRTA